MWYIVQPKHIQQETVVSCCSCPWKLWKGVLLLESINVDSCISAENQHVCGLARHFPSHRLNINARQCVAPTISQACPCLVKKKSYPCNRPWDVKDPALSKLLAHRWHMPHFTPQKHYLYFSGTNFCYRLNIPQGLVRPEGLDKFKKSPHRIWNPRPSGL
jgi:hypothetical protein